MKTSIRQIIISRNFGLALLILSGLIGFSLFTQFDQGIILPIVIVSDILSPYNEYVRHSNYDPSNILDCNDADNPYNEYECFRDAYSNCYNAKVSPEIYTIEGDPIYTTLLITPDCNIQGTADMSTDRFWAIPEVITTKCDAIGRNQYVWTVESCDADNLPEMQFNFEMQLYPKILECEEQVNTWIRESLECDVN